ncbi:MAG: hypothetical protein ACP5FN_03635 [Candidatus Micrarchaeia archaeon]
MVGIGGFTFLGAFIAGVIAGAVARGAARGMAVGFLSVIFGLLIWFLLLTNTNLYFIPGFNLNTTANNFNYMLVGLYPIVNRISNFMGLQTFSIIFLIEIGMAIIGGLVGGALRRRKQESEEEIASVLKNRYARGEITKSQYNKMKKIAKS